MPTPNINKTLNGLNFNPSAMAIEVHLSSLSNPLVTIEQLTNSSSQLDGVPVNLERSIRYAGAKLTQAAGILLRLPQEIIAQAIVSFTRFYMGSEGGSFRMHAAKVNQTIQTRHLRKVL